MKEYIEASNPAFAIGEYWDSLAYEGGNLCYNQGDTCVLLFFLFSIFFPHCCSHELSMSCIHGIII